MERLVKILDIACQSVIIIYVVIFIIKYCFT